MLGARVTIRDALARHADGAPWISSAISSVIQNARGGSRDKPCIALQNPVGDRHERQRRTPDHPQCAFDQIQRRYGHACIRIAGAALRCRTRDRRHPAADRRRAGIRAWPRDGSDATPAWPRHHNLPAMTYIRPSAAAQATMPERDGPATLPADRRARRQISTIPVRRMARRLIQVYNPEQPGTRRAEHDEPEHDAEDAIVRLRIHTALSMSGGGSSAAGMHSSNSVASVADLVAIAGSHRLAR